MHRSLHQYFGFSSFRPGQEEAIQSLLAGQHTLAVMPTGSGKSLIFQFAALHLPGTTLVISPLIALMKDQVDALSRRNIAATFINSTLSSAEQSQRMGKMAAGEYRLVYIAPERLRNTAFLNAIRQQKITLLAVDEAHCISEWGHDFRPDYLEIGPARAILGDPLTVALTATATPQVQKDIQHLLRLPDTSKSIVTGFNRPNLKLNVLYATDVEAKFRSLQTCIMNQKDGATIVYTGTRREAEETAVFLSEVCRVKAFYYHAGLPVEQRTHVQNEFIRGTINIITATNAFGMGIDRSDVRQVIHFSLPSSLEAYYQEAGRAGRDGAPAAAVLLYQPQDRALQEFFIKQSELTSGVLDRIYNVLKPDRDFWTTLEDLSRVTGIHVVQVKVGLAELERAGAVERLADEGLRILYRRKELDPRELGKAVERSQLHLKSRQIQLEGIVAYAETNRCRRATILKHFGDVSSPDAPDCCDNCHEKVQATQPGGNPQNMEYGQRAALIILDTLHRLKTRIGKGKLALILKGSKSQEILSQKYDRFVYYGRLAVMSRSEIEGIVDHLSRNGYIKSVGGEYPVLTMTPKGEAALANKSVIPLELKQKVRPEAVERKKAERAAGSTYDYTAQLFSNGMTPEQIAKERNLSPLTIYGHFARLIGEGKFSARQLFSEELIERVERAIDQAGAVEPLFPIYMLLQEEVEYNIIRCVIEDRKQSKGSEISQFLLKSHPRPLTGPWHCGWALGFHSRFSGADWSRSGIGDLTFRLKYQGDLTVIPALIENALLLLDEQPDLRQVDCIIPVPPSTQRKVDPVSNFCKVLSEELKIPVCAVLTKRRSTQPQKELKTIAQKRSNVSGAFAINDDIKGKKILLVDDLYDSGATLEEIHRVLIRAGAGRVGVLTLTRTIHADA